MAWSFKMRKKLLIIDLDQTVIDSSIRENYCYPNGILCLNTYKSVKSCPDMGIVNDGLTPFGFWLNGNYHTLLADYRIVFLTARLCDIHDAKSFRMLGIDNMLEDCLLIERGISALYGGNPNEQDSGKYKKPILWYLVNAYKTYDVTVIDDDIKVLDMVKTQGFKAICARDLYHFTPIDFNSLFSRL